MIDFLRNIKWFLLNLWTFRAELWEYRPWDWAYVYGFNAKLWKDMGENIRKHGNHVGAEKTARRLMVVSRLYDDLTEKKISPRYSRLLDEWWSSMNEVPCGDDLIEFVFPKDESLKRKLNGCREDSEKLTEQKKKLLFKYLYKYSESFWD